MKKLDLREIIRDEISKVIKEGQNHDPHIVKKLGRMNVDTRAVNEVALDEWWNDLSMQLKYMIYMKVDGRQ
jgi:hypothetical protein